MDNLARDEQPAITARRQQPKIPAVTLEEILRRKEARAALQRELLRSHPGVLLGLLVNMPGCDKQTQASQTIHRAGRTAVRQQLEAVGWQICAEQVFDLRTGPESLFLVQADEAALKALAVAIEEQHPLGRLFDLDVIGRAGLPGRRCLICGDEAAICSRSQRHPYAELQVRIRQMLAAWEHDHGNG
jgi:holo-ACP synthase CitX